MKTTPILAALLAATLAAPSPGQPPEGAPPPEPAAEAPAEPGTVLGVGEDRWERMTVPVNIVGKGPYAFIVDTGAERTAISEELAEDLHLAAGATARVHSMTEVSRIATVVIPTLEVGGKSVLAITAPALERRNIGAEGILGVDTLQKQRVSFDFVRQLMTVTPGRKREPAWPKDTIVITARNRFGHLVLVDASVEGEKVWVILDTGAQTTIGNSVLRRKLAARGKVRTTWPITMQSVTGGRMTADAAFVRAIRVGGVDIRDMPVAFADVHPFRALGLMDRPALLLGMDALRLFERVSVDFPNRKVRLLAPARSERDEPVLASAAP